MARFFRVALPRLALSIPLHVQAKGEETERMTERRRRRGEEKTGGGGRISKNPTMKHVISAPRLLRRRLLRVPFVRPPFFWPWWSLSLSLTSAPMAAAALNRWMR